MMNADCIQLGQLIVQILVLIVLCWGLRFGGQQLKQLMEHDMFDYLVEYTRRYSEIMRKLPIESADEKSIHDLNEEQRKEVWAYLDLCGEEWFMATNNYIPSFVWKEWKEGIQESMGMRLFTTGLDYWKQKGWIGDGVFDFLKPLVDKRAG